MSEHTLAQLGWDGYFHELFPTGPGLLPGRVARVDRGACDVLTEGGPVRARSTGLAPAVGDWAAVRPGPEPELAQLLPRRTAIARAAADGTSRRQVLAANVDTVAVVASLAAPPRPGRVERLLALAWDGGARPVVVLTKSDLAEDVAAALAWARRAAPGADVLATSATTGEGLDALAAAVTGTCVLLGPSGAGKSSLANALAGSSALGTAPVRASDGKGRHTTVHRQLLPLPAGGVLIDTPGLRGIGLSDAVEGIARVFEDVEELAGRCRFTDCAHGGEPGCAVADALAAGDLDPARVDRYRRARRESAWQGARADTREALERKRRDKGMARAIRQTYRFREQGGSR